MFINEQKKDGQWDKVAICELINANIDKCEY
jgi:hypothetical protein